MCGAYDAVVLELAVVFGIGFRRRGHRLRHRVVHRRRRGRRRGRRKGNGFLGTLCLGGGAELAVARGGLLAIGAGLRGSGRSVGNPAAGHRDGVERFRDGFGRYLGFGLLGAAGGDGKGETADQQRTHGEAPGLGGATVNGRSRETGLTGHGRSLARSLSMA